MLCIQKINTILNCKMFKGLDRKLLILLPIALFLILAVYNLNYPGMSIDEAGDGIVSSYILKDAHGYNLKDTQSLKAAQNCVLKNTHSKKELMITNFYFVLFNRIFPVMSGEYVGSVFSYLIYPFSLVLGLNVITLRITPIFFSVFTLIFIYLSCKIWFGTRAAFLAALLTAVNLVFVQYSRVGLYREEIFIVFFFWAGFFLLLKYFETKRNIFLYFSLYFWGLGFSAKIIFLFYAVGITVAYMLLRKKLNLTIFLSLRQLMVAVVSFCLGAFSIIAYNLEAPLITLKVIFKSLFSSPFRAAGSNLNINNLDYLANFKLRFLDLMTFLKANIVERTDWGVIGPLPFEKVSFMIACLTIFSFIFVLIFALFSQNKSIKYRILFIYVVYITVIFLTPFTVSGFCPGHLTVLLPFFQIALALFLDYIWQRFRNKKPFLIAVYSIFLIPLLLFNIWLNIYFNNEMKKNGGYRRWSTTVYELADYLQKNNILSPITFGWGLKENIAFITHQEVVPLIYDEAYSDLSGSVVDKYKQLSLENKPIFYLTMGFEENIPKRDLFMKLARESGKKIMLVRKFFNRKGDSVYWLYKIF